MTGDARMPTTGSHLGNLAEVWRTVPGHDNYEVSNLGRFRSWAVQGRYTRRKAPKIQTGWVNSGGYLAVSLGRDKSEKIHVLVAAAFLGSRPDGMHICHKNGDKVDNRVENLRYGTVMENAADRVAHGRSRTPHRNPHHRYWLSDEQVREIRRRADCGEPPYSIAKSLGMSPTWIGKIANRQRRTDVPDVAPTEVAA